MFFSGLAVAISIGGLFLLDDPLFRSMAVGTIAVVVVAVIGSLTFLPATLAILGDGVNRLRIPFLAGRATRAAASGPRLVTAVMRRPVVAAVAVGALLLSPGSPVLRLRMGQTDFTSFPDSLEGVQAVNLLNEKWPSGGTSSSTSSSRTPISPRRRPRSTKLNDDVLAIDGAERAGRSRSPRPTARSRCPYVMNGGENDVRNQDIVRTIRSTIAPTRSRGVTGRGSTSRATRRTRSTS